MLTLLDIGTKPKSTVISPALSSASSWLPPVAAFSTALSGSNPGVSVIVGESASVPEPPAWIPLSSPSVWLSALVVAISVLETGALLCGVTPTIYFPGVRPPK